MDSGRWRGLAPIPGRAFTRHPARQKLLDSIHETLS
jgi:hypothetical protein